MGLQRSLFERLYRDGGCRVVLLNMQYRMTEVLWAWPNQVFYDLQVHTAESAKAQQRVEGLPWKTSLAFVHVGALEQRSGTSSVNPAEAECALRLAQCALRGGSVRGKDVGILTPYAAQKVCIKGRLRQERFQDLRDVIVADVDGFQGQERDFIVISLVRSNPEGRPGFVDDANRVNVLLTRARRGLVLIGNEATLRHCHRSCLGRMLASIRKHEGGYVYQDGVFVRNTAEVVEPPSCDEQARLPAKAPRCPVPMFFSMAAVLEMSPGPEVVARDLRHHGMAVLTSVPFLVALCHILDLTNARKLYEGHTASVSPGHWDRKAWSREHFFASVGLALDPGNSVLATALWALMMFAEVRHACYVTSFHRDTCQDTAMISCHACKGPRFIYRVN